LHSQRIGDIDFPPAPTDHIVVSGDKKGVIAAWDMDKVRCLCARYHCRQLLVLSLPCAFAQSTTKTRICGA
jgi:hypothetical protein